MTVFAAGRFEEEHVDPYRRREGHLPVARHRRTPMHWPTLSPYANDLAPLLIETGCWTTVGMS